MNTVDSVVHVWFNHRFHGHRCQNKRDYSQSESIIRDLTILLREATINLSAEGTFPSKENAHPRAKLMENAINFEIQFSGIFT
jgi:hypothetical protein